VLAYSRAKGPQKRLKQRKKFIRKRKEDEVDINGVVIITGAVRDVW